MLLKHELGFQGAYVPNICPVSVHDAAFFEFSGSQPTPHLEADQHPDFGLCPAHVPFDTFRPEIQLYQHDPLF